MENKLYLSMGALVERRNGYDTEEVARTIPLLTDEGYIDGAEFMFIRFYYGRAEEIAKHLLAEGCRFPTFHTDKDIGAWLSDAGVALGQGEREASEELRAKALDSFRYNCETACAAKSERLVLHLWGGLNSDSAVGFNAAALPEIAEIAEGYGLRVMVENVPSTVTDPLTNLRKIQDMLGRVGVVFDTRFATCHDNAKETLSAEDVTPHIEHVHISDYRGGHKEFKCLRPVFHPGEGRADFGFIFSRLKELGYSGSFTLESPGIVTEGPEVDRESLRRSLSFIKSGMEEKTLEK